MRERRDRPRRLINRSQSQSFKAPTSSSYNAVEFSLLPTRLLSIAVSHFCCRESVEGRVDDMSQTLVEGITSGSLGDVEDGAKSAIAGSSLAGLPTTAEYESAISRDSHCLTGRKLDSERVQGVWGDVRVADLPVYYQIRILHARRVAQSLGILLIRRRQDQPPRQASRTKLQESISSRKVRPFERVPRDSRVRPYAHHPFMSDGTSWIFQHLRCGCLHQIRARTGTLCPPAAACPSFNA